MSDGNQRSKKSRGGQGKGGQSKGNGAKGNQAKGSSSKKKRSRGKKRQDQRKFWGDVDRLPQPSYELEATATPEAMVNSLGRPPIPGHETSAQHYFKLVYDRSVGLAFALAAAGGLDQPAPTQPEPTASSDNEPGADDAAAPDVEESAKEEDAPSA